MNAIINRLVTKQFKTVMWVDPTDHSAVDSLIAKFRAFKQESDKITDFPRVAVDFDGTIADCWNLDECNDLDNVKPREGALEGLEKLSRSGVPIVIWTAHEPMEDVRAWLDRYKVKYEDVQYKVPALAYIDDRAINSKRDWDEIADRAIHSFYGKVRQPEDTWDGLEKMSEKAQPELEEFLKAVKPARTVRLDENLPLGELEAQLRQPGSVLVLPKPKTRKRAQEKVEDDYGGNWSKLLDINRASVAFDTRRELRAAADILKAAGQVVRPAKDRFLEPLGNGYRDYLVNYRLPGGSICEVQLHLKPMLIARERVKMAYDVVRAIHAALDSEGREDMTPAEAEAVRRARKAAKNMYAQAWQECLTNEYKGTARPANRLKGFCPTGEGGGTDNSCGSGSRGGGSSSGSWTPNSESTKKIRNLVDSYEDAPDGAGIGQKGDVFDSWRKESMKAVKEFPVPEGWDKPSVANAAWSSYVQWDKTYEDSDGDEQQISVVVRFSSHDAFHKASESDLEAQLGRRDDKSIDPYLEKMIADLPKVFAEKERQIAKDQGKETKQLKSLLTKRNRDSEIDQDLLASCKTVIAGAPYVGGEGEVPNSPLPHELAVPVDTKVGPLKVKLIDRDDVNAEYDESIIDGGNGYRYSFIPKDEVWLAANIDDSQLTAVLYHKAKEAELCAGGMSIDDAHAQVMPQEALIRVETQDNDTAERPKGMRKGYNPIADLQKIGEELAHRKEPPYPMPGYGQIYLQENGSGKVWYIGGDGDDREFGDLMKERLLSVQGIDEVTYEAEAFPPEEENWIQVYPKQKADERFKSMTKDLTAVARWLAARWQELENRYGRKTALVMAVGMLGTMALPGSIPAIIAAAETIRGIRGYFQAECGGVIVKGDTVMDLDPALTLRFPVNRLMRKPEK